MKHKLPFSSFRKESMEMAFKELNKTLYPTIVEVGRIRFPDGMEGDGFSTFHFGMYADERMGRLISIDCNPETEKVCRRLFSIVGLEYPPVLYVNVDPEHFHVPSVPIDLLYLDGPDCTEGNEVVSAYWHRECMKFMEPKIVDGGLVLIDDCMDEVIAAGKGATAIPYLLNTKRYEVVYKGYQWLLKKIQ